MEIIQESKTWRVYLTVDEITYDDSYIDTWDESDEGKVKLKQELWARIKHEGVWAIVGEVKCEACGSWEYVDSVYGLIGNDYDGSGYVEDILRAVKAPPKPKPVEGLVIQSHETLPDGVRVIIATLSDGFDTYKKLPEVVSYDNRMYGKTGWNSDAQVGYYRDDAKVALAR